MRVDLAYTIPSVLWNAGAFDAGTRYRTVPITRYDAERIASDANASLSRYKIREDGDNTIVSVRFRPSDPASLSDLFGGDVIKDGNTLMIRLSEGGAPLDSAERELVDSIVGDSTLTITVRHRGSLVRSNLTGIEAAPNGNRLEVPFQAILAASEPVTWTLVWE